MMKHLMIEEIILMVVGMEIDLVSDQLWGRSEDYLKYCQLKREVVSVGYWLCVVGEDLWWVAEKKRG